MKTARRFLQIFRARHIGWSKERIGSHVVRNNRIYDCGQNGVVGHLGRVFSEIYGNEIYNIAVKHEFYGHEIAGIKLHAAIDVKIHDNYIHNCSLGTWLEWQAQGGAYVHNLCCGFLNHYPVLNRSTPYHLPHSTQVLGTAPVYGGDDRWYQNLFVGGAEEGRIYGTAEYDGSTVSMEEYVERFVSMGHGDVEQYEQIRQPAYVNGNVYLKGAKAFAREENLYRDDSDPRIGIVEEGNEVFLEITLPTVRPMFWIMTKTEVSGAKSPSPGRWS